MKKVNILFVCAIILGLVSCKEEYPDLEDGIYAEFNTNQGTFVAELYYEQTPTTVANFVSLAEGKSHSVVDSTYKGKKFYDGLSFHRVIKDFMIQGGDPTGTGGGDPGYRFPDEIVDSLTHNSKGYLSMANAGPGTNGSQFFITLAETPWLDGRHTIFGKIAEGQDVVDKIGQMETGPQDRPVKEVIIENVNIIRKGKAAKNFDAAAVFEDRLAKVKAEEEELAKRQEASRTENAARFSSLAEDATQLESGLKIHTLKKGDGPKPAITDMVKVLYEGYFVDGTLFDTNVEELAKESGVFNPGRKDQGGYGPMTTKIGPDAQMIPGFKEGLQNMSVGDKVVLFIPSHLAYGPGGAGNVIPPNSDLIFVIEMAGIQE
ncbi:peptidylprolyl isomerase [Antarcticibacterium arcticum]|uniref:peptidylprolyl isomerase n=1 Tax=Antarcticibacterium arcticum TaxID=2585771 RepID=A0A5B8YHV6_9FLAO|nr:peptidylprolyl isomerase [Antarcticibacterium arcticum]QED37414.1 peptidylprolyl isomerase [Antarcticibacterium arcticum]